MRIEVRDPEAGAKLGRVEIDLEQRPTRAAIPGGDREIFLEWEAATDDAGRLRHCLVCGCRDMYAARVFPQITGFVVVLAFTGAAVGIFGRGGIATNPVVLGALVVVLVLDIASLVFRKFRLVCYRCRSVYSDIEIARHFQPWDRATAEKHRGEASAEDRAAAVEADAHRATEVDAFEL